MKQIIRIGAVLLMAFLIPNMSGCESHTQNDSENAESLGALSSSTLSGETSNDINGLPDDVTGILLDNQRNHMEKEKTLREDASIAATVNGTPIYQAEIEIKMSANNTNRKNFRIQLETMNLSEQEKTKAWEDYASNPLPDQKAVLNELICDAVIQLKVTELNLFPTEEDVLASTQERYALIRETPRIYASVQLYIEVMNLSEEAYIRQLADEQRKDMGRTNLYLQITKNFDADAEKDKAFEIAVDEWVAQADIKIING